jgi:hypothetical protein
MKCIFWSENEYFAHHTPGERLVTEQRSGRFLSAGSAESWVTGASLAQSGLVLAAAAGAMVHTMLQTWGEPQPTNL